MRPISTLLTCAALGLVVASAWAQTAPSTSPATATAPATGRGRGGRGGGAGGFGGAGGGGGAARGGGSILDQVAVQGNGNDKSTKAHQDLLTKAKLAKDGKAKIDVYVEGDSIMRRWGCDAAVEP